MLWWLYVGQRAAPDDGVTEHVGAEMTEEVACVVVLDGVIENTAVVEGRLGEFVVVEIGAAGTVMPVELLGRFAEGLEGGWAWGVLCGSKKGVEADIIGVLERRVGTLETLLGGIDKPWPGFMTLVVDWSCCIELGGGPGILLLIIGGGWGGSMLLWSGDWDTTGGRLDVVRLVIVVILAKVDIEVDVLDVNAAVALNAALDVTLDTGLDAALDAELNETLEGLPASFLLTMVYKARVFVPPQASVLLPLQETLHDPKLAALERVLTLFAHMQR
jgi:hypothetical protein